MSAPLLSWHEAHPCQIADWKRMLLERAADVFAQRRLMIDRNHELSLGRQAQLMQVSSWLHLLPKQASK